MTETELIQRISENTEFSCKQVGEVVDLFLGELTSIMAAGGEITLFKFGIFGTRHLKERTIKANPVSKKAVLVKERFVPNFQAATPLRKAVRERREMPEKPVKRVIGAKEGAGRKTKKWHTQLKH
ncbi:hypothetical protein AGMMS49975_17340 [Clostridia bacterium]|nr:hypothetical protein AGMMS49975_17340 [Clostridia bacterium]